MCWGVVIWKDIQRYCSENRIIYLTTLDFLYYAYCRGKMTEQECLVFMRAVNNAGSKLPVVDITRYTCNGIFRLNWLSSF